MEDIVGREYEVGQLLRGLHPSRAGAAAILIEGEPGVGKTLLWSAAVRAARERGLRVLTARPAEVETKLSYAVLGDLLEPELEAAVTHLPSPQRRALEIALLLADPDDDIPDHRAVAVAVLGALRGLADGADLVLAVDDVQWLDADTERVLTFALRRLTDERLLLLLARRRTSERRTPLGLDAVLPEGQLIHIQPGPLDPVQLHGLLKTRLELDLARPLLLRLHAATGGNPLYALEIGRALVQEGWEPDASIALPVPETLVDALETRLAAASPEAAEALLLAAAVAQPTRSLLEAVSGEAAHGLSEAAATGIVELDGDDVRFVHPLYASVAYARAPAAQRRAVHRRLAERLTEPEERAVHLARGAERPDAEIAGTVAAAARHAAARGAPEAALDLAHHALRLTPPDARDRAALSIEAADFAFAAGDTRAARARLEDAMRHPDTRVRTKALVRLATLATYDGSMLEARRLAGHALGEAADDPATLVVIHRRLALAHLLLAELDRAEHHTRAAIELAEDRGDRANLARALANLACVRALRGDSRDVGSTLERALALEDEPGPASIDDSPSAVSGLLLMYAGDLGAARARLQAGLTRAQSQGGDPLSTGLLFALSEIESRAGRFEEALRLAERGLSASEQTGQSTERAVLLFAKGLAEAHLGRAAPARIAAQRGIAIAQRAEHRWAVAQNQWVLGFLEVSLGRPREAWAALAPAVDFLRRHDVGQLAAVPVHPEAVEATIALGDVEEARRLLAELDRPATPRWLRAAAGRYRGLLRAAEGDTGGAEEELEEAVREHRELELPFALGRTLLALGAVQRRVRHRARARASLEASVTLFAALRAELWEARAEAELARIGGRRAADRDVLTPTERRVAELASNGRSNREIAAELFISERTVEANLTRAYRKLGVRSRTQLAGRLPSTS